MVKQEKDIVSMKHQTLRSNIRRVSMATTKEHSFSILGMKASEGQYEWNTRLALQVFSNNQHLGILNTSSRIIHCL